MHLFSKVNIFFLLIGLPFQSWSQGQVPGAERADCSAWIWSVWRRKSHFNCMPYLSSEILRGRKIFHALLLCWRDQCRFVFEFEVLVKPWKICRLAFNSGMDEINEMRVWKLILASQSGPTACQTFYFSPTFSEKLKLTDDTDSVELAVHICNRGDIRGHASNTARCGHLKQFLVFFIHFLNSLKIGNLSRGQIIGDNTVILSFGPLSFQRLFHMGIPIRV